MLPTTLFLGLAGTALAFHGQACQRIAVEVSSATGVYYPGSPSYIADNDHYVSSSSQSSKCSVEPGSAEDVGIILGILGETKTPFGIKGGGHATNQGFSSTTGVQIAMTRFNEVTYDSATHTAAIGAGNIWDDVYAALDAQGVNVLGGRVTGIGVAGFTLGGGYSWLSNQHGLAIDNVLAYELVVPNGTVVTVKEETDPELFFSLKGGGNNYGIVTRFTVKAFPQGTVWGGIAAYNTSYLPAFTAATVKFCSEVTDPKAGIIIVYGYTSGQVLLSTQMFYDGPTPPIGIFDDFLAIPAVAQDVTTRSFFDLINSTFATINPSAGYRTVYNDIPELEYSESTIRNIIDDLTFWGPTLSTHSGVVTAYALEPFLPSLLTHAPAGSSAYPGSRAQVFFPTNLDLIWVEETEDEVFHDAARKIVERLGVEGAPRYPNYAIIGTPVVDMFGQEGLRRMQAVRERVDPEGVMQLTGGFKV
ncbi:FAD-binding domain-containing protein [Desarmillaria tabescens]|uniref:FAD-binding domain-containing protein n=1 Tax=Armillaria tabescens TaxID=1929756 RepID=A0AA39N7L7_ARMTA|nr:FAD-binding domain-containing protein [Desarmillaria tabescens]KAK0460521.1 FAD-binding domain-containing protein [Desarmillaria tabescens]